MANTTYAQFLEDLNSNYGSSKYHFYTLYVSDECVQHILKDKDLPFFVEMFYWKIDPNLKGFDYYVDTKDMERVLKIHEIAKEMKVDQ